MKWLLPGVSFVPAVSRDGRLNDDGSQSSVSPSFQQRIAPTLLWCHLAASRHLKATASSQSIAVHPIQDLHAIRRNLKAFSPSRSPLPQPLPLYIGTLQRWYVQNICINVILTLEVEIDSVLELPDEQVRGAVA